MTAMSTATGTTAAFNGADVDGLDKVAQECTQAAQVCDEVRMACEIIVAAASFFGPFGAAFIAYLKGVVIPWLQKISQALQLFARVLSAHSAAQRDASSAATSLPSYTTPAALPPTSTANYPVLPTSTPTGSPTGAGAGAVGGPSGGASTGGASVAQSPAVQQITAVTNLLNAIAKLEHPDAAPAALGGATLGGTVAGAVGTTGTVADPTGLGSTGLGSTGLGSAAPGSTGLGSTGLGSTGLGGSTPLSSLPGVSAASIPAGDAVGTLSVPVAISPDGHITPLLQTNGTTAPIPPTAAAALPSGATHPIAPTTTAAPATHLPAGGGSGSGGGGFSGAGGGSGPGAPVPVSAAPAVIGAHPADALSAHAPAAAHAVDTRTIAGHAGASHDGLYSGLGQATGIGAGAAALARATLAEARQRAEGGRLGGLPLPFDAGADGGAQLRVFDTELGG